MSEKVNISLAQGVGEDKPVVIHLLEGKTINPFNQVQTVIEGDVDAVKSFLEARKDLINKEDANIIFNEENMTIILTTKDTEPYLGYKITAKLEIYPALEGFGINSNKFFNLRELESHIKMNRFWFQNRESQIKLLGQLNKFAAKVNSEIQSEANNRGNKNEVFNKTVTAELVEEFTLSIPLFKGNSNSVFRVEICFDVTDRSVRFWLESVELAEAQMNKITESFIKYKNEFTALGFTTINQ